MRLKESNSQPEEKSSEEFPQNKNKNCPNCGQSIDREETKTIDPNPNEFRVHGQEFPQALGHSSGRHYL